MAGQTSLVGYSVRYHANALRSQDDGTTVVLGEEPCDSGRAIMLVQNLKHLRDSFPQYRVNSFNLILTGLANASGVAGGVWVHETPITLRADGRPCSLDVRIVVGTLDGVGDIDVTFSALRYTTASPSNFASSLGAVLTGSVSATTGAVVIDDQFHFRDGTNLDWRGFDMKEQDGVRGVTHHAHAKLEIHVTATGMTPGQYVGLVMAQVREFVGIDSDG